MATLWYGSGLETLPISATMGVYGYAVLGFVLVVVVPEILTRLLKPTDGRRVDECTPRPHLNLEQS
jgi:hypothetical protein